MHGLKGEEGGNINQPQVHKGGDESQELTGISDPGHWAKVSYTRAFVSRRRSRLGSAASSVNVSLDGWDALQTGQQAALCSCCSVPQDCEGLGPKEAVRLGSCENPPIVTSCAQMLGWEWLGIELHSIVSE